MKREEVYKLVDSERDYQDSLWMTRNEGEPSGEIHTLAEWIMFIESYLLEAKNILTRESYVTANPKVQNIMRKVAGLAVAALEEWGAEPRK